MKHPSKTFRHIRHWFVPHKHNNHRPHLIRAHGLAVMAVLILGVQASAYALQPASARLVGGSGHVLAYASDITPVDLLNQTNAERAAAGLPALRLDSRLNQSASLKAGNMFAEDYWAHVSPSGIQPWYWFNQAGYPYKYAGENLAKDFDTSAGATQGWMNSPGHRANILNANYTDVGFAVQNGTLVGGQTTLVVAHYGSTGANTVTATVAAPPTPAAKPPVQPAATPAPTTEPTPAPTVAVATPAATPVPTSTPVVPAVKGRVSAGTSAPAPVSYSLFKPLSLGRTLTWGTLVTIFLLIILLAVYFHTHMTVWRKGLARWRTTHYRLTAAAQISGLAVIIVLLAVSGFGKVS
ncbi:MAG: hypothetical protein JWN01_441 [Patescibacteria group bacterium]|nr:hypothetical protein [Patescibacteria group bacterium]